MCSKMDAYNQDLEASIEKLEFFFKRYCLRAINNYVPNLAGKLYQYTGRQNSRSTQWFMQVDRFVADHQASALREDLQAAVKSCQVTPKPKANIKRVSQRFSIKRQSTAYRHKGSLIRKSTPINTPTLLPLNSQSDGDSIQEQDDMISRFRQQKTRREQYKNKVMEAQRNQIFKLISQALTNIIINPSKKVKRQKLHQIDHFINMQASVRQPNDAQPQPPSKTPKSFYRNKKSKTQRGNKSSNIPYYLSKQKEHLKAEDKIYLLNAPNEIKLNSGVVFRDNQKYNNSGEGVPLNRKKLQFLKNEEINPIKIKMSELMSYKKITTMTNLAYCSSMKTVKEIPKDAVQSKISIDSKQLVQQSNGSRKLIKIANRRIYEQLLIDFTQQGEANAGKSRFKSKKQNKVRFQKAM